MNVIDDEALMISLGRLEKAQPVGPALRVARVQALVGHVVGALVDQVVRALVALVGHVFQALVDQVVCALVGHVVRALVDQIACASVALVGQQVALLALPERLVEPLAERDVVLGLTALQELLDLPGTRTCGTHEVTQV